MKFNRILSTVLVIVMLLTGMIATFPISAAADSSAESPVVTVTKENKTEEEILAIVQAYQSGTNYSSAQEMLQAELTAGYLDSIVYGDFVLYVNRYTGMVYYVNTVTGQILTSNPVDLSTYKEGKNKDIFSQITITYATHAAPKTDVEEYSFECILESSFITVSKGSNNSIVVKYQLGESEAVNRVPDSIFSSDMEEYIIAPMFEKLAQMLETYLGPYDTSSPIRVMGTPLKSYNPYITDVNLLKFSGDFHGDMINDTVSAIRNYSEGILGKRSEEYKTISAFISNITTIFNEYTLYNPDILSGDGKEEIVKLWYETVPNMQSKGENVFLLDSTDKDELAKRYRLIGKALKANLNFSSTLADELNEKTGFMKLVDAFPQFECSLVYSISKDGSLIVDFPAASLKYSQDSFIVKSVSYLPYFGSADMNYDGYIFFPDGSGTIIEFEDFYSETSSQSIQVSGDLYGKDFCYATITDKHKKQVSMPVYGMISTVSKGDGSSDTVKNGYLAILEDGSALTKLRATSGGGMHKYANAYSTFVPYCYDEYMLGDVVSVGGSKSYLVVSESRYTGSYKTRYVMLTDPELAAENNIDFFYPTTYVGMASCYRDYLKEKGVLDKISNVKKNLPLYIETLGSMNVTQKILTFPVSVSTPLTKFEDIQTMYKELSAKGINNVNFRLTGFANGGMYFTYPAKVRWENSLGGARGFEELLSYAASVNKNSGANLGIYPDFDFQYINNTAIFDRVSNGRHGAKLVDNRYASKQVYDSVSGLYETLYAILVSSNTLDGLYDRFIKDYAKYDIKNISVSTLGSDLNSNFDDDNPINRDQARGHVVALLDRMANKGGYSVMTDVGNAYTYKFVDHILNATIDSSHLVSASYTIPFLGMVLHSYISYTGTPLNYTGSADYNILHSIENGAALYYILCMQNTNYLKEDTELSKYYGVDYKNWFDEIVESYKTINAAIGDLQKFEIVDHYALIAERVPNSSELISDISDFLAEYVQQVDKTVAAQVAAKLAAMREDDAMIGKGLEVQIDKDALVADAIERFSYFAETDEEKLTLEQLSEYGFISLIDSVISKYQLKYPEKDGSEVLVFDETDINYESVYKYYSNSVATDEDNYKYSDYTSDNGSVVIVAYKDTNASSATYGKTVLFLINYNNYDVSVTLDSSVVTGSETKTYRVGKLSFIRIDV